MKNMKAIYIGFQQGFDDIPGFKLFNIDQPGHPIHKSTVDEQQLCELGIDVSDRIYPLKEGTAMQKPIQEIFTDLLGRIDVLNDAFYLATKNEDAAKIDRVGREIVLLGKVIKDVAYKLRQRGYVNSNQQGGQI